MSIYELHGVYYNQVGQRLHQHKDGSYNAQHLHYHQHGPSKGLPDPVNDYFVALNPQARLVYEVAAPLFLVPTTPAPPITNPAPLESSNGGKNGLAVLGVLLLTTAVVLCVASVLFLQPELMVAGFIAGILGVFTLAASADAHYGFSPVAAHFHYGRRHHHHHNHHHHHRSHSHFCVKL